MKATNDELNRWIAVSQEPLPVERLHYWPWGELTNSPKGFWKRSGTYAYSSMPIPNDFCADSAMTVMLLEKLVEKAVVVIWGPSDDGGYVVHVGKLPPTNPGRICDSIGRAVAEAFALANGCELQ